MEVYHKLLKKCRFSQKCMSFSLQKNESKNSLVIINASRRIFLSNYKKFLNETRTLFSSIFFFALAKLFSAAKFFSCIAYFDSNFYLRITVFLRFFVSTRSSVNLNHGFKKVIYMQPSGFPVVVVVYHAQASASNLNL